MLDPILFSLPDITDAEVEAVTRVLRSGWITSGAECQALEAELAAYLGLPHVVAVSSGTAALETAYAYLGLPPGARVGVPTWTFVASALAPAKHGAVPVLLDVDPATLNLSSASLKAALDEGLDAVVVVHFGGVAVAKEIHEICAHHGVPLIEDAAHALGARDHRGLINGHGSAGACFSFYATKNLTSAEGGALGTDDDDLATFARSFRLHGLSRDAWKRYQPGHASETLYDLEIPGIKANLPDVMAAIARAQLVRFHEMQRARRSLVERYRTNLNSLESLRFIPRDLVADSADHLVVVVLPRGVERRVVVAALAEQGIGTSVHFQPLHTLSWFRDNSVWAADGLPVASALALRTLSLPLHPTMRTEHVDRVCEALTEIVA